MTGQLDGQPEIFNRRAQIVGSQLDHGTLEINGWIVGGEPDQCRQGMLCSVVVSSLQVSLGGRQQSVDNLCTDIVSNHRCLPGLFRFGDAQISVNPRHHTNDEKKRTQRGKTI
jgi:hypothetical protein